MKKLRKTIYTVAVVIAILLIVTVTEINLFADNAVKMAIESVGTKALQVGVCQNSRKKQVLDASAWIFGVFCERTHWGSQKIVAISMRFRYSSVHECFGAVYMENTD